MYINKIDIHFLDCIANLQKCVAFSDVTQGKSNPAEIIGLCIKKKTCLKMTSIDSNNVYFYK